MSKQIAQSICQDNGLRTQEYLQEIQRKIQDTVLEFKNQKETIKVKSLRTREVLIEVSILFIMIRLTVATTSRLMLPKKNSNSEIYYGWKFHFQYQICLK